MKTISILLAILLPQFALASEFGKLFKNEKPIIAAIMVDRLAPDSYVKSEKWLLDQARIASEGKMDGLLVEYRGGGILSREIPAWEFKMMTDLTKKVITSFPNIMVGVEILWHFPGATINLAKQSGAKYVRIDFFSDDVIADSLKVPLDPKGLMEYRKKINADDVLVLTDIQVKYSKMIDPKISIDTSAARAEKFGSDGVIVSGAESGSSPDSSRVSTAKKGTTSIPVVIGSGFSMENAPTFLPLVDAVIVGTSISEKTGGPLLPEKVGTLMSYVQNFRKNKKAAKGI